VSAVRHPLFARLFVRARRHEPAEEVAHRGEALAGVQGRVVEVGAGDGGNFAHYPACFAAPVAVGSSGWRAGPVSNRPRRAP
jgi:hypothetical protein